MFKRIKHRKSVNSCANKPHDLHMTLRCKQGLYQVVHKAHISSCTREFSDEKSSHSLKDLHICHIPWICSVECYWKYSWIIYRQAESFIQLLSESTSYGALNLRCYESDTEDAYIMIIRYDSLLYGMYKNAK